MHASALLRGPGKWSRKLKLPNSEYILDVFIRPGAKPVSGKVTKIAMSAERGASPDTTPEGLVARASAADLDLKGALDSKGATSLRDVQACAAVGEALGLRAKAEGVRGVIFLKPKGTLYQGRLKSFVDAFRSVVPLV
ncbi:hypothetical protein RI054_12g61670 [Pseudoscourfieldia marina]